MGGAEAKNSHILQLKEPHCRQLTLLITIIMRPPIDFEKAGAYENVRDSFESDDGHRAHSLDEAEVALTAEKVTALPPVPYSAFSLNRRRFILGVVTAAGFFGPLCGAIYLPSLPVLKDVYKVSETVMTGSVSIYLFVFAIAVRYSQPYLSSV